MATLGIVAAAATWQVAVAAIAVSSALILSLVGLLYRDLPRGRPGVGAARPRLLAITARELRLVLLAGAAFSLVNAALVVFTSFTPLLLIERGRSEAQAGLLASWASWALIGAVVLAGYLLDRARRPTLWLALSALLTAVTCLALPAVEPAWLWIVLFGLVSAPVTVGSMALPGEVLRADSRNTGFGLFFTMNYLGFGLLPPVAGYLLDVTRSTAAPLWFGGALYLSIMPLLLIFRRLQGRPDRSAERREEAPSDTASRSPST
jgi:MFS family permease